MIGGFDDARGEHRGAERRRLLAGICRAIAAGDASALEGLLADVGTNWTDLANIADDERLSGFLSAGLRASPCRSSVPEVILARLRRAYLRQWTRNGELFREIERLSRAFAAAGVRHLFFKGPILARRLHAQLGARASHDVDLLIPGVAAVPRAETVLVALGYRRTSRLVLPLAIARVGLCQLEYRGGGFVVEPHWSLARRPSLRLDPERPWREAVVETTPGGLEVPALADEDTLLANLLSIPTDLQNGARLLRTLLEIELLRGRLPGRCEDEEFRERRRRERTGGLARIAFAAASVLFAAGGRRADDAPGAERALVAELVAVALDPFSGEWRRRRLALALFEASLPKAAAWWALTLPVRAMAHPGVTLGRLRRRSA